MGRGGRWPKNFVGVLHAQRKALMGATAVGNHHRIEACLSAGSNPAAACKLCTIRLERLCSQRALWFRILRATLASAVRAWSLWHRVDPALHQSRSQECHACIRFRKNVREKESRLFRWLDGYMNPLFN